MMASIETRSLTPHDLPLLGLLHAKVFGPGRFARTAYRVREGTGPVSQFCRGAFDGDRLIAVLTLTGITVGGRGGALLLGPLAVDPDLAGQGHGRRIVREALDHARAEGVRLVVLVGDESYYGRLGFGRVPPGRIVFPGPVDPARVLAAELSDGALASYSGVIAHA